VTSINKLLLAGFEGENNSAKILLDKLCQYECVEKLFLRNDFEKCTSQIVDYIKSNNYKFIIAFGQKPVVKSIYFERYGCINGQKYKTRFEYESMKELLENKGYKIKLSDNAGNYLCNHVYGIGLNYIENHNLLTEYLFVHIPTIKT